MTTPVEAQAVPDLHQQIMNLPTPLQDDDGDHAAAYRCGFRDARHAAAQLVAASRAAAADIRARVNRLAELYADDHADHYNKELSEFVAQLVAASPAAADLPKSWEDRDDQWTQAIEAAHPIHSGAHKQYATALEMVGNRHSKGALVELVCWLLQRASSPVAPVGAPTEWLSEAERLIGAWATAYDEWEAKGQANAPDLATSRRYGNALNQARGALMDHLRAALASPVAPVGAPTEEREAFEAALGEPLKLDQGQFSLSRAYGGDRPYTFLATQWAWRAWQARALL